jgi:uncharacterized membrane protein YebE (DUF533 family)
MGLGTKVLIGAGLAAAGYAAYKGLKKYGDGSAKAGATKLIGNIKNTAKEIFKPEEPKASETKVEEPKIEPKPNIQPKPQSNTKNSNRRPNRGKNRSRYR